MANESARRIQTLANQIDLLSAELNTLLSITDQGPPSPSLSDKFRVGDRVQILNKYKVLEIENNSRVLIISTRCALLDVKI